MPKGNGRLASHIKDEAMWNGPAFGLSIELGRPCSDAIRISKALDAFWRFPQIEGPWATRGDLGVHARLHRDDSAVRYGLLKLAPGNEVGFSIIIIAEEEPYDGTSSPSGVIFHDGIGEGADWLTLDIPFPMLGMNSGDSWSVSLSTHSIVASLCEALVAIADAVFAMAPYPCAVLGEEVSGCWREPTPARCSLAAQEYPPMAVLTAEALETRGGFLVSPELWSKLNPRVEPRRLPSSLLYAPPLVDVALRGA